MSVKVIKAIFLIKMSFILLTTAVTLAFYVIRNNPGSALYNYAEDLLNAGATTIYYDVGYVLGSITPIIIIVFLILHAINKRKINLLKVCCILNILFSTSNIVSVLFAALIAIVVFANKKLQEYMSYSEILNIN